MDLGLSDKVAVVLASSDGLGLAVARALLAEGARVAISGRDEGRLRQALEALAREQGSAPLVTGERLDVTDRAALERHLGGVRERWGGVDVLVTNAGGPPAASALEVEDQGLRRAFELTLLYAVHAVQVVLPWMRAKKWGRIIGLTSLSVRQPIPTLAYSNMMRTGLTAYLKSLAGEVGREGVLVNSVCTGLFATQRLEELFEARSRRSGRSLEEERRLATADIPLGRLGEPREFGDLVAFLASERCSFLSGVALTYDGGASRALL